jgi:hypothetical protein
MILDSTIVNTDISASAEIAVSKLADGAARQLLQTDAAGTGVEWASNIDIPGTLDVTGAAVFDSSVAVTGALTKSGNNVVTVGDTGTVTSTMILDDTIVNADINASAAIVDTKLATIATADKVSLSALNIDGGTDIGAALADADLFIVDDGGAGTNRKAAATRITDYAFGKVSGDITIGSTGTAAISSGVIVNADVNASAAIAGTKISPDFGSQTVATTGLVSTGTGTAGAPTITFTGDTNTGIYSPGADQVAISTNSTERVEFGTSEVVFNDGGANYDFRIEGDTNANLFFVDASTDRIGIGTTGPAGLLQVQSTDNLTSSGSLVGRRNLVVDQAIGETRVETRTVSGTNGSVDSPNFYVTALGWNTSFGGQSVGLRIRTTGGTYNSPTAGQTGNFATIMETSHITGATIDYAERLRFASGATTFSLGGSERARIDSSGRLLIGTSSYSSTRPNAAIHLDSISTTAGNGNISLGFNGTTASSRNVLTFYRTRGLSAGAVDIVNNGDQIGTIAFNGADGVDALTSAAQITAEVDGTPGTNEMPGRLVFSTATDASPSVLTERMRITSNAYVRLASGTGGIQFNGDTAAVNALDDYEEGTFTPFLFSDAGGEWAGKTTNSGSYTKIGRLVHCQGEITWSSKAAGASGVVRFRGLPFVSTGTADPAPYIRFNATELFDAIRLQSDSTLSHFRVGGTAANAGNFGASGNIVFNFVYRVS